MPPQLALRLTDAEFHGIVAGINSALQPLTGFGFLSLLLPFLMTGLLGGFTTFSAFSLDTLRLLEAGRAAVAFSYVGASVILSLAACLLGLWLAREVLA